MKTEAQYLKKHTKRAAFSSLDEGCVAEIQKNCLGKRIGFKARSYTLSYLDTHQSI